MFFHTTCADLLRHALAAEAWTVEAFVRLFELEAVLGRPQGGREAGRFRHVDYEHVACERAEHVAAVQRPAPPPGPCAELSLGETLPRRQCRLEGEMEVRHVREREFALR